MIFCKNVTIHFQKSTAKIAVFQGNCLLLIEIQVEQKVVVDLTPRNFSLSFVLSWVPITTGGNKQTPSED